MHNNNNTMSGPTMARMRTSLIPDCLKLSTIRSVCLLSCTRSRYHVLCGLSCGAMSRTSGAAEAMLATRERPPASDESVS